MKLPRVHLIAYDGLREGSIYVGQKEKRQKNNRCQPRTPGASQAQRRPSRGSAGHASPIKARTHSCVRTSNSTSKPALVSGGGKGQAGVANCGAWGLQETYADPTNDEAQVRVAGELTSGFLQLAWGLSSDRDRPRQTGIIDKRNEDRKANLGCWDKLSKHVSRVSNPK